MKVVDCSQMESIDSRAQNEFFIPQTLLMEDAGLNAYRLLRDEVWEGGPPPGTVLFLVGRGNNGGDALVMARRCFLEGKRELEILLAAGAPKPGTPPDTNLKICAALGIPILEWEREPEAARGKLAAARWIVDGILGTGMSGEVKPPLRDLILEACSAAGARAAVDLPSGLGDSYRQGFACLRADVTLTIGLPKRCLYLPHARALCGRILVVPGVFPPALLEDASLPGEMLLPQDFARRYPPLAPDTYKTRRGHLAVFAGQAGTTGAAWLAANAAARSRAGLVSLHLDRDLYSVLAARFGAVMVRPWDGPAAASPLSLEPYTAVLAGPGWGVSAGRKQWLKTLIDRGLPGVLDADGLSCLAELRRQERIELGGRWILTPHPGEFARLLGRPVEEILADPLPEALGLAAELNATVVLKSHLCLVASPEGRYWILDAMNPALATGGSGDVLSGIIAGFLAGGLSCPQAAGLGLILHSQAGRAAWEERGFFIAEDLLPYVSLCLKRLGSC